MSHSAIAGRLRAALAAGGILLLAACAGASPESAASGPTTISSAPSVGAAPEAPEVAALPSPAAPLPAPPQDVKKLIGLKGEILRQWMGNTVFVRHDGIAEIWRFAAETCFLDVFLYRENDGLRVAYLDARPRDSNQRVLPQSCYGLILADHKRGAS